MVALSRFSNTFLFTASLWFGCMVSPSSAVTITFATFPDGSPIADETVVLNQFEPVGIRFEPLFPNSPRVKTSFGGILVSGGPTGFYDDIGIDFLVPVTSITVDIIGSGLNISARLEGFNLAGTSLGGATHTYTGPTGQPSSFTFFAPPGQSIARAVYNGGLNPSAASIDTLSFIVAVAIDIKPGGFPNLINPTGHGTIPVAILSSTAFSAPASVNISSLTFGRTGAEQSLAFCNLGGEDVNGDALLDLVCHFKTQETGFQKGDTLGVLKGQTINGTPLVATDSIVIVQ